MRVSPTHPSAVEMMEAITAPYTPTVLQVRVRGTSPLMMDNPAGKLPGPGQKSKDIKKHTNIKDEAESSAYRIPEGDPKGQLGLPPRAFFMCNISGGIKVKYQGGGNSHMSTLMTRALMDTAPLDPMLPFIPLVYDNDDPITEYVIDGRPIGLPGGGKAMKYRPKMFPWEAVYHITYIAEITVPEMVVNALARGGITCGVGSFRPEKKGPFGRFRVVEWHHAEEDNLGR